MNKFLNIIEYPDKILYQTILKCINYLYTKNNNYINFISFNIFMNNNKSNIDNPFLSNEHKLFLKNYIENVNKKLYLIFKVIFKWKCFIKNKYKNKLLNNKDLFLDKIDFNKCIYVYINKKTYLFSINDIINIINTSLFNYKYNELEPLCMKNPYTNCIFSIPILYKIYNQLSKYIDMNDYNYIYELMICEFNIDLYLEYNYKLVLDLSFDNFFNNLKFDDKLNLFIEFIQLYNKINIRHFFKKDYTSIIKLYDNVIKEYIYTNLLLSNCMYDIELKNKVNELKNKSEEIYKNNISYFYIKFKNIS